MSQTLMLTLNTSPATMPSLVSEGVGVTNVRTIDNPDVEAAMVASLQVPFELDAQLIIIVGNCNRARRFGMKNPAGLGGCRLTDTYVNDLEQYQNNLELAGSKANVEGMSAKNASIGELLDRRLVMGGAKATIWLRDRKLKDLKPDQRETMMFAFGMAVGLFNHLHPQSRYITAEDVNTNESDMLVAQSGAEHAAQLLGEDPQEFKKYIGLLPPEAGGHGNPSPFTSLGAFYAAKGAAEFLGLPLQGSTALVSGCGHTGKVLAMHLAKAGVKVMLHDPHPDRAQALANINYTAAAVRESGLDAEIVETRELPLATEHGIDIFAPCAFAHSMQEENIRRLEGVKLVCGTENNIFADVEHDSELSHSLGMTVIAPFIANMGGATLAVAEYHGVSKDEVSQMLVKLSDVVKSQLQAAKAQGISHTKYIEGFLKEYLA